MINHLRTLLLNLEGNSEVSGIGYPGEEYVPEEFRPMVWPEYLNEFRTILFGTNPDRAMVNYRLAQLMSILHSSDLDIYTKRHDSRLSYWPLDTQLNDLITESPIVTPQSPASGELRTIRNSTVLLSSRQLYHKWIVEVIDSNTVRVTRTLPFRTVTNLEYVISDNWSNVLSLTASDTVKFTFEDADDEGKWTIEILYQPEVSLNTIVQALESAKPSNFIRLFGDRSDYYEVFWRLWSDKTQPLPHRLGSVVLAIGDRLHELYTA